MRNRFWPPPPAKADIATAILTNVIEHLVLLLPPNKHAFTAKAVWADFHSSCFILGVFSMCLQLHSFRFPLVALGWGKSLSVDPLLGDVQGEVNIPDR